MGIVDEIESGVESLQSSRERRTRVKRTPAGFVILDESDTQIGVPFESEKLANQHLRVSGSFETGKDRSR